MAVSARYLNDNLCITVLERGGGGVGRVGWENSMCAVGRGGEKLPNFRFRGY
jgi:hypothetical protein